MTDLETVDEKVTGCSDKKCSDHDEECWMVVDPLYCWLGGERVCKNGVIAVLPPADGYCPLVRAMTTPNT